MQPTQLRLDLVAMNRAGINEGKKDSRISFTADEDLDALLKRLAALLNTTVSELCQEYVIECSARDIGQLMLRKAKADKKLRDLV